MFPKHHLFLGQKKKIYLALLSIAAEKNKNKNNNQSIKEHNSRTVDHSLVLRGNAFFSPKKKKRHRDKTTLALLSVFLAKKRRQDEEKKPTGTGEREREGEK